MNVRDVEDTIHTLEARHPGLNEVMLLTLLKAGGWEEKDIETAKVIFKSSPAHAVTKKETPTTERFPPTQEEPVFEPVIDEERRIEAPEESVPTPSAPSRAAEPEPVVNLVPEPVSLVSEESSLPAKEDIPHNLPLRPFETSEHIWPFSRYRDVFYGEEEAVPGAVPSSYDVHHVQNAVLRTQVTENITPSREQRGLDTFHSLVEDVQRQSANGSPHYAGGVATGKKVVIVEKTGDEKLIIMAGIMLLAILLLLGYMYSNGRL